MSQKAFPWYSPRVWVVTFVVTTIIAFSSAVRAPFEFDDLSAIRRNASIRQLTPIAVPFSPPPSTSVSGRPVVNLSLALNYAINDAFGVDQRGRNGTIGYHALNVLVHLVCGMLLFALLRRTLTSMRGDTADATVISGLTTLLWLLHPIQTEAVDYVIQRTELIVSACYLGVLYASMRAWDAKGELRFFWYALAIVLMAVGMASKEVMVTAPILVVLYDRAFRTTSWRSLLGSARLAFYAALIVVAGLVFMAVAANARSDSVGTHLGLSSYQYFSSQMWAIAHYLRLIAWPNGLTFDYGEAPITGARAVPGLVLLAACGIATVIAWTKPRVLWAGFVGAWFFLILAPSSSFVPISTEIAAERRIYLASAAVFLLVVLTLERLAKAWRLKPQLHGILAASLVVVLMGCTFARGLTYADPDALHRDTIAKAPSNPRAYVGAGMSLFESGPERFAEATGYFRKAIEIDSTYFAAWQTLGLLSFVQSRWDEAIDAYGHAARLRPSNLDAVDGLARAYVARGSAEAAMPYVDRLGGADRRLLWSLGDLLVGQGKGSVALRYLEPAASAEPSALGLALLSAAYAQTGRTADAVKTAASATSNAGDTVGAYVMAGRAMLIARKRTEARVYLNRALELDQGLEQARRALESIEDPRAP
ncbi:MAG: hypothetical protein V4550_08650 [Gemmatimonadota bacterium]